MYLRRALLRVLAKVENPFDKVNQDIFEIKINIKKLLKRVEDPEVAQFLITLYNHLELSLSTVKDVEGVYLEDPEAIDLPKLNQHIESFEDIKLCRFAMLRCLEAMENHLPATTQIIDNSLDSIKGSWARLRSWSNRMQTTII